MQRLDELMEIHSFFRGMNETYILMLSQGASEEQYQPGDYIFHQRDKANYFYLIMEGSVALEVEGKDGSTITIEMVGPDEAVGWSWLFPPYYCNFSARVLEPTLLLVLDGRWLRERCNDDHELGYELYQRITGILMERLQTTRNQLLENSMKQP